MKINLDLDHISGGEKLVGKEVYLLSCIGVEMNQTNSKQPCHATRRGEAFGVAG